MAYRASTVLETFGGPPASANLVGNLPAGTQNGDVLLALVVQNAFAAVITTAPGWFIVQDVSQSAPDGCRAIVYAKIANGEPSSWTWVSNNNSVNSTVIVGAWSGRNVANILISAQTINTASNATPVSCGATGVTALQGDDLAWFGNLDQTVAADTWGFAAPASFTERVDDSNGGSITVTLSTQDNVAAGATGTLTATATRAAGTGAAGWSAVVVSIASGDIPVVTTHPITFGPPKLLLKVHKTFNTLQPAVSEDVTLDKWNCPNENPVRRATQAAILAGSLFFVPVIAQAEVITVDKWYQPISQPQNKISYRQTGGESRFEVPRTVLVTDWFQPASLPVLRKPTQLLGGESRFEVPRIILISDWFQEIRQPYFSKFRLIPFGEYRFETPRTILVTDWYQPIVQPFKKPVPLIVGGESRTDVVVAAEIVTLDKWYRPASEPYFTKRRDYQSGQTFLDVPRTVLLTDWFQPANQPFFNRKTNSNFGEYRFEVPRDILLSDWFSAASEPIKQKVRQLLQGGESRVDVIVSAEVVTLDKWFQPTSQPLKQQLRQLLGGEIRVEVVTTPEDVTLDKWYQPVQQPQRKAIIQVGEWQFMVQIVTEPTPPIPPIVIESDPISRDRGWGKEDEENERRRIKQILDEDDLFLLVFKTWLKRHI